jgi:hypothetical protein
MPAVASNAINPGQVSVGTSGAIAVPARADRKRVTLMTTTVAITIGTSTGVLTSTGATIPANSTVPLETTAAIYAVAGSSTTLFFIEEFS